MKTKAFLFIILASILWGTSGIFVQVLAPYGYSSLQLTALRGCVAFACMLLFVLLRCRHAFRTTPSDLLFFIGIGISLFGTASCYFISMQLTSISTAVVLMYTAPVYVMLFSVCFLGERFSREKRIALCCMLVGCCLVSGVIGGLKFDLLGVLFGVLSGLSYGAYNILTKLALRRNCSAVSTTLYGFAFMSLIALSVSNAGEILTFTLQEPKFLIPMILALGIVTYIAPYVLYTLAMKELPAGTASALGIVEPMAATLFSVVLFHEKMTVYAIIGMLLIFAAILLLSRSESQPSKTKIP